MRNNITSAIDVLIVDDRRFVREGLKGLLLNIPDVSVVGEAETGHVALELVRQHRPCVVVMDLSMPGTSAIDLIRRIKAHFPQIAVLGMGMRTDEQHALRALQAGASGCLVKDSSTQEMASAIHRLASGGAYVSESLAEYVSRDFLPRSDGPSHTQLTNREFEICRLLVAGERLTDIADMLHLSVKTVSTHKAHILEKLGLDNAAALVKYSVAHHLFEDTDPDRPSP